MAFTATTLADLKALLLAKLDHVPFYEDAELRLALNESLRTWNLLTGRWRRRIALDTVAGQIEYALPATMVYGMRVLVSGRSLTPSSQTELDLARPSWRLETVASGGDVPTVPIIWAPGSLQRIALWPTPAAILVGGLVVDGISATPVLVEDGDSADIGEDILDDLLDGAIHILTFKEAGPRWRATTPLYEAFLQAAAEQNAVLKANQAFRRYAGLDRARDLAKAKGVPTRLDGLTAVGGQS